MKTLRVDDPIQHARQAMLTPHSSLPDGLEVGKCLGKGSNNRVFRATWKGMECVLRAPRRRADTQQRGNATWEFCHSLAASKCGAGPKVYASWRARHAKDKWPSGLYMVTEWFPYDLEHLMVRSANRALAKQHRVQIRDQIVQCLFKLAINRIFVYDLKPSNLVVRVEKDHVAVRVIDFGRDFCEIDDAASRTDHDHRAPHIAMVRQLLQAHHSGDELEAAVTHLLFMGMLVQFSSTTTRQLHADRDEHRMGKEERAEVNPIAEFTRARLEQMQGRHVAVLRQLLRSDDVRGVLQHYNSRRDAGTHRTFRLARGEEF